MQTGQSPVRVVGSGHSWSNVFVTDGTLLNLDALNSVISVDKASCKFRVQAGIRLHDLNRRLQEHGLAMRNLGAITEQSIAGATATGTHGTGISFGALHTQIVALKLITGAGEVKVIDESNADWLRAARLSLGALGVITEVTLDVTPAYNLDLAMYKLPFEEVVAKLPKLVQENTRIRIYWFPGSNFVYVNTINPPVPPNKPVTPDSAFGKWFRTKFEYHFLQGTLWNLGTAVHQWIPTLNSVEEMIGFTHEDRVGVSYEMLTRENPPKHIEGEYAVPIDHAQAALRALHKVSIDEKWKVNVPSEIRFVRQDDAFLSPAMAGDVCYIGAYMLGNSVASEYIPKFERVLTPLGARPHWGKRFNIPLRQVRAMYPSFHRFADIRREADPDGRFLNPFLSELFAA